MTTSNGIKPIEVTNISLKIPAAFVQLAPDADWINFALVRRVYFMVDSEQGDTPSAWLQWSNGEEQEIDFNQHKALLQAVEALAIAPAAPSASDVEIVGTHPGDLTDVAGFPYIH